MHSARDGNSGRCYTRYNAAYAGTNIVHPRNVGFRRVASAILFIFEGGDLDV